MEPRNRSGQLAVDQLRVRRPLLSLSTATTTSSSSSSTATTTATTHLESSAALGTLFVFLTAVLLVFFLWLYSSYCVNGQTADRTTRGRRMRLQLQRQGLRDQSSPAGGPCTPLPVISTLLPAVAYSSVEGTAQDCAVCLSEFEGKDAVKVIPCCGHVFHQECIDRWLDSQGSCPVCRRTEILGSDEAV